MAASRAGCVGLAHAIGRSEGHTGALTFRGAEYAFCRSDGHRGGSYCSVTLFNRAFSGYLGLGHIAT